MGDFGNIKQANKSQNIDVVPTVYLRHRDV